MDQDLQGKVVVVTGAASGIGRAGCEVMSRSGATVVAVDINSEAGNDVVQGIIRSGGIGLFVVCDVTDSRSVSDMVEVIEREHGRIDGLFHNAMDARLVNEQDRTVTDLAEDVWNRIISLVLTGTFHVCKYVGRAMMQTEQGGSMVLTATVDALIATPGFDAYTAAKCGVIALTRSLAAGLGSHHIRVNAVCPGFVETPHQTFLADPAKRQFFEALHLAPIAKSEDIAEFAKFLISDRSRVVTGGIFPVDSGYSAFKIGDDLMKLVR